MRDRIEQWIDRYGPVVVVVTPLIFVAHFHCFPWLGSIPRHLAAALFSLLWIGPHAALLMCGWHMLRPIRKMSRILEGGVASVVMLDVGLFGLLWLAEVMIGIYRQGA